MSQSCQRARTLGKFWRQTLIARISCHLFDLTVLFPPWKLFTLTPMEKSKAGKSPWVKKTKKTGPKKKEKAPYRQGRKNKPCRKRQRLLVWPNTLDNLGICWRSGALEVGASSLKIKVNVSAGCEQDSSSESGGSDEENETYPRELISAIRVFLKLSVDS